MRLSKIKKLIHELPAPVSEAWLAKARLELLQSIRATAPRLHDERKFEKRRLSLQRPFIITLFFRPMAALLSILILLGGSGATVLAAQGTVPGEVLYPVKRASERALLSVAASAETKVDVRARIAERRLQEAEKLIARNGERKNQEAALSVLAEFNENMDAATRELPRSQLKSLERAIHRLDRAVLRQQDILIRLEARELAPETRAAVLRALHHLFDEEETTFELQSEGGAAAAATSTEASAHASGTLRTVSISEIGALMRARGRIGAAENVLAELERKIEQLSSADRLLVESEFSASRAALAAATASLADGDALIAFREAGEVIRQTIQIREVLHAISHPNDGETEEDNDEGEEENAASGTTTGVGTKKLRHIRLKVQGGLQNIFGAGDDDTD
jgi:hypothetical protein